MRRAGHSSREVGGMKCLRSRGRWDRGFESHSGHGCLCVYMRLFCVCAVMCLGSDLATG
jgi:hypothetical protein